MSETKVTRTFAEIFGDNLFRFATQLTREEMQRNRLAVALARHAEVLMAVQQAREERDRLNNDQTEQRIDREKIEAADNEAHVRELLAKLGYLPANGGVL